MAQQPGAAFPSADGAAQPGTPSGPEAPRPSPPTFGQGDGSDQPSGLGLRAQAAQPSGTVQPGDLGRAQSPGGAAQFGAPAAENAPSGLAAGRPRLEPPNMGQLNRPMPDAPHALNPQIAHPEPTNPQSASPQPMNPPGATQPGGNQPSVVQPGAVQPGAVQPGAVQPGVAHDGDKPARAKRPPLEPPNMGQLNRPLGGGNAPHPHPEH